MSKTGRGFWSVGCVSKESFLTFSCSLAQKISIQRGRLILIKSVLANLPIYLLSSRLIPSIVVHEIEKLIRQFLWGSTDGVKKFHFVVWEILSLPFEWDGLGLRNLRIRNNALLCKWFWQLWEKRYEWMCLKENMVWNRVVSFRNLALGLWDFAFGDGQ